MKRFAATLVLVLMSSLAFALPSPKDIETAVNAGQLTQAESMLNEVLREKPNSAKAHYELGEVLARQGRNDAARQALLDAQRLDPALKFARSPQQFNELLKKIPATSSTASSPALSSAPPTLSVPSTGSLSQMAPVQAPAAPSFPWTYVLLGGGALFAGWLMFRRSASASTARMPGSLVTAGGVAASGGNGPAATGAGYGPQYGATPQYGAPPQSAGHGIGGAVLGGVAGLAAGYGLAKVLEHGNSGTNASANHVATNDSGFIPLDQEPKPEYGSFDAGSGDSWDAADDSSSSDDSGW